jgi:tripartite-type tricarboxylate transporter receptor subunit TctC
MKTIRIISLFIAMLFVLSTVAITHGQEKYPFKPIHLIVPMAAGGGTDRVARALAETLKNYLPQPVLVENVPGAGSVTGMSKLNTSKPDGYTLGVVSGYLITTALEGMAKFPATDFTFIAKTSADTFTFSVPAESKHKTLKEMIEASKAEPDKITLANAGTGALTHLAGVALNQNARAKFRIVPFVGGANELTALLGGHIDAGVFSMSEVLGQSQPGGKIRNLAVFSDRRTPKLPDTPSLSELDIKGIPEGPWQGIAAPKGLPDDIKNILIEAMGKATKDPYWKGFIDKFGYADRYLPGKEFEAFFKEDIQMLEGLMKSIGTIK